MQSFYSGACFLCLGILNVADDQHRQNEQRDGKYKGQTAVQAGKPSGQVAERRGECNG